MNYTLKDKLTTSKDFLSELIDKSWAEIEHLQTQIANIDTAEENTKLIQLFKNLLTSYYVFIGGLENLNSEEIIVKSEPAKEPTVELKKEDIPEPANITDDHYLADLVFDDPAVEKSEPVKDEYSEPFEYFVDFDEPIGEPLTDDDIYNNN
jgi:hypothetical protein